MFSSYCWSRRLSCKTQRQDSTVNTYVLKPLSQLVKKRSKTPKRSSLWHSDDTAIKDVYACLWCPAVSYHTVNQDTERNPEDEGKHHDWAHYVISQELPWWRGMVDDVCTNIEQLEFVLSNNCHSTIKIKYQGSFFKCFWKCLMVFHIAMFVKIQKQLIVTNLPNVLMSSLSIKSHSLSITSCTCFMHFPCFNSQIKKKQ